VSDELPQPARTSTAQLAAKTWKVDTETKGTQAQTVVLEKLLGVRLRGMPLDLTLVDFHGETTASSVFGAMRAHTGSDEPWTHEVAIVEHHHHGHMTVRGTIARHFVDVDEGDRVSQTGAAEGALTGAAVGLLLGPPGIAAGLVLGGITGAEVGQPTDVESEPARLVDDLRAAVAQNHSAIMLLAAPEHVDTMLAALEREDGKVTRRTLSGEEEAALLASLSDSPGASPGPS